MVQKFDIKQAKTVSLQIKINENAMNPLTPLSAISCK
jgi:hypothetical protein